MERINNFLDSEEENNVMRMGKLFKQTFHQKYRDNKHIKTCLTLETRKLKRLVSYHYISIRTAKT